MKTVNVELKKRTILEAYNQVKLLNDLDFPNFQKGEPINNLMKEIRESSYPCTIRSVQYTRVQ